MERKDMTDFKEFLSGRSRQFLMGFAILWIIGFHFCLYGNLLHYPLPNFFFGRGYLGVDIFIFLSCYGLCHSYERRSLKDYYRQRVRRLFPMYLAFLALLLALLVNFYSSMLPYSPALTALLQLTGLSSFFTFGLEWYIPALILIYAAFPFVYKSIRFLYRRSVWWVLALMLLLVAATPLLTKCVFNLFALRFPLVVVSVALHFALSEGSQRKLLLILASAALMGVCFIGTEMFTASQSALLVLPMLLYLLARLAAASSAAKKRSVQSDELPVEKGETDGRPFNSAPVNFVCFCGRHSLELYLAQNLALNQFYSYSGMAFVPKTFVAVGIIVAGALLLWGVQALWVKLTFRHGASPAPATDRK